MNLVLTPPPAFMRPRTRERAQRSSAAYTRSILRAYQAGEAAGRLRHEQRCPYASPAHIEAWGQGFAAERRRLGANPPTVR